MLPDLVAVVEGVVNPDGGDWPVARRLVGRLATRDGCLAADVVLGREAARRRRIAGRFLPVACEVAPPHVGEPAARAVAGDVDVVVVDAVVVVDHRVEELERLPLL
jgi:hypothetical protein